MMTTAIRTLLLAICICRLTPALSVEDQSKVDPHQFNEVMLEPIPETDPAAAGEECDCQQASYSSVAASDSHYSSQVWSEPEP